jgi:hypothetical protein
MPGPADATALPDPDNPSPAPPCHDSSARTGLPFSFGRLRPCVRPPDSPLLRRDSVTDQPKTPERIGHDGTGHDGTGHDGIGHDGTERRAFDQ